MRILIACEYSGVVRDAFIKNGHNAVSCDLLPTESLGPHYQGDVRNILDDGWDMMIAHPPCTHLATSGAKWFKYKQKEQKEALEFVRQLLESPIDKIALENPISIISSKIKRPNQIIQPWQFGHNVSKKTCLWLKNLPDLKSTKIIKPERYVDGNPRWGNQTPCGADKTPPSKDRWKIRSKTYLGIANAMASQWG